MYLRHIKWHNGASWAFFLFFYGTLQDRNEQQELSSVTCCRQAQATSVRCPAQPHVHEFKMTALRSPSIRSRLALLVMACIVPALVMVVMLISSDYHRSREQLVQNSVMTARAMAAVVDKEFAIVESSLLTLAASQNLATNNLSKFQSQANAVLLKNGPGQGIPNVIPCAAPGKS